MSIYSTALIRNIGIASYLMKAIANENRLMILCQLRLLGESNVTQLLENLSVSQSALSQHLSIMNKEGIVSYRKKGNSVYYKIKDEFVLQLINNLENYFGQLEVEELN